MAPGTQRAATTTAATVQLSVPVLAALGGVLFLGEQTTPRLLVASVAILGGIAPPMLIPAVETGVRGRPTLRRGDTGQFVTELQQRLGMPDGPAVFGPKTEAAVRAFQRERNMVPDGIIGPKTWAAIDATRGV